MKAIEQIAQYGVIKEFPSCENCGKTEQEMKEKSGRAFLMGVRDKFVCGECVTLIMTPRQCKCGGMYTYDNKFCPNCGVKI